MFCLLAVVLAFSGCSKKNGEAAQKKYEVAIVPDNKEYSSLSSSSPGLGLMPEIKTDTKNDNIKFHWTAEEGTLLKWVDSKVTILGKDITNDGERIYWAEAPSDARILSPFKVYLRIEEKDSSKVLYQASLVIQPSAEGISFSVLEK